MARPRQQVFDWVGDHRNVRRVLDGVQQWEPLDAQSGLGSRYRVRIGALGLGLGTTLRLTDWRPPQAIGWESDRGPVPVSGRWRFKAVEKGTEVHFTMSYEPPYGVLGRFLGARLEGLMRTRIKKALRRMKEALEE